jgi:hypothetical protein
MLLCNRTLTKLSFTNRNNSFAGHASWIIVPCLPDSGCTMYQLSGHRTQSQKGAGRMRSITVTHLIQELLVPVSCFDWPHPLTDSSRHHAGAVRHSCELWRPADASKE